MLSKRTQNAHPSSTGAEALTRVRSQRGNTVHTTRVYARESGRLPCLPACAVADYNRPAAGVARVHGDRGRVGAVHVEPHAYGAQSACGSTWTRRGAKHSATRGAPFQPRRCRPR